MRGAVVNGRYEVLRELGHGGMGIVYLVEDRHDHNRRLALKLLVSNQENCRWIERFRVEFAGLSRLRHPNIAAAYDFGRAAGTQNYFFTSEHITGVDIFRGTVNATTAQVLDLMAQTLRGIEVVHSNGYVHNDLKPSNILLELVPRKPPPRPVDAFTAPAMSRPEPIGRVKIIDFGLFSAANTAWQDLMGTPQFLSPERIRGESIDERSDLYALGFVFYALLARTLALPDGDSSRLLQLHLAEKPPSLSFFRPDLPATLVSLVERLMEKRREDRYSSAAEALGALDLEIQRHSPGFSAQESADLASGQLHGREKELLAIQEQYLMACACSRDSSALILEGPAGVGKTRLVRELRGLIQGTGGAYVEIPGNTSDVTAGHAGAAIWTGFETSGLRDFAEARQDTEAAAARGDGPLAIARIIEQAVFHRGFPHPVLLFFDDFHNTSPDVRALALELIRAADQHLQAGTAKLKVLIVLGWSTADARSRNAALPDHLPILELKPFDSTASREFVRALFHQDDIPEAILSSIVDSAQGLPGRLLALAVDMVEGEYVQRSGSAWVFPVES